ncbi:ribonuclease PH [Acidobacteriota bacterium]
MSKRSDGRRLDELRSVSIESEWTRNADGSALIRMGNTIILCTASVEERVPAFLRNSGKGWITSEYGMLPGSTDRRTFRESTRGRTSGRSMEIQRLIGRSLRSVAKLEHLTDRTIWIDCDVLQADGGTRTASITGGFVALALACHKGLEVGRLSKMPLTDFVGAVSVGMIGQSNYLDLNYQEDSSSDVDLNVVKTGRGRFVEIQGTAENNTFSQKDLERMLRLSSKGIKILVEHQKKALKGVFPKK